MTRREAAEKLVESLFDDLNDRQGYDTGGLADDVLADWKREWDDLAEKAMEEAGVPA
jgi:hypothetical protein